MKLFDALLETKLFVYGTLKKGEQNHKKLKNSKFLGKAKTKRKYDLVYNHDSPNLVQGNNQITGELYEIDDALLQILDKFEKPFKRKKITLSTGEAAESYFGKKK